MRIAPHGGNFLGLAGEADLRGQISQTIAGLTIGQTYFLDFEYAGAQLRNSTGAFTEKLRVTFGSQTFDTATVVTPSTAFSGWKDANFAFVATATSQQLSFQSIGSPSGSSAIALLDGLRLTAEAPPAPVPEPASWALMIAGFGGVGVMVRRRQGLATAA